MNTGSSIVMSGVPGCHICSTYSHITMKVKALVKPEPWKKSSMTTHHSLLAWLASDSLTKQAIYPLRRSKLLWEGRDQMFLPLVWQASHDSSRAPPGLCGHEHNCTICPFLQYTIARQSTVVTIFYMPTHPCEERAADGLWMCTGLASAYAGDPANACRSSGICDSSSSISHTSIFFW